MNFTVFDPKGLPGLRRAKSALDRLLAERETVHSVLFAGHQGSGATVLARWLAMGWMCLSKEEWPCLNCSSCRAMLSGSAVDFQTIAPTGASRIIRINQLRAMPQEKEPPPVIPMTEFFRTRPLQAKSKVIHIQDAERMNSAACNSLLKTLEEPPPHAKLVLTSESMSHLPATILSRCLIVICESPSEEELSRSGHQLSEMERVFSEAGPERLRDIQARQDLYENIWRACEQLANAPAGAALRCAEEFRELGEAIGKAAECGSRQGHAEVLRCLGAFWARHRPGDGAGLAKIADSHRLIIGNGNAQSIFDALFARLLV